MLSIRRVLKSAAQYLGDGVEDDGLPWMDHLEKAQEQTPGLPSAMGALDSGLTEKTQPTKPSAQEGKSLIEDVGDPRSLSKDRGGPAPSDDIEDLQSGSVPITHFLSPSMYSDDSSLQYWWDSRGREDIATGTPFDRGMGLPVEASMPASLLPPGSLREAMGLRKEAAKLESIISMNSHPKRGDIIRRSQQLTPKLESTGDQLEKGILYFTMKSPSSDDVRHVVLHFLKEQDGSFSEDILDNSCLVGCDCPAFVFWGPLYYASSHNYLYRDLGAERILPGPSGNSVPGARIDSYGDSSPTAPTVRGQGCTFCKHIYAAYRAARSLAYRVNAEKLSTVADHVVPGVRTEEQQAADLHLDSYQDFQQYVNSGSPGLEVMAKVKKTLEMHGASLDSVDKYITDTWNSLMAQKNYGVMTGVMLSYKSAPSQLVYLLQRGIQLSKGKYAEVPPPLLRKAWDIVNGYFE